MKSGSPRCSFVAKVRARRATTRPTTQQAINATSRPATAVGMPNHPHITPSDAANLKSPPPADPANAITKNGTAQINVPTRALPSDPTSNSSVAETSRQPGEQEQRTRPRVREATRHLIASTKRSRHCEWNRKAQTHLDITDHRDGSDRCADQQPEPLRLRQAQLRRNGSGTRRGEHQRPGRSARRCPAAGAPLSTHATDCVVNRATSSGFPTTFIVRTR